jgi:hypothetical protein
MNIFPELLNIHATLIADFPKSGSASFQGMDSYRPTLYEGDSSKATHQPWVRFATKARKVRE